MLPEGLRAEPVVGGGIPVLLDCDPGIDDAIAIAYLAALHRAETITWCGLVATAGNVGSADTTSNALGWLELAGVRDVPVAVGATEPISVPHDLTPETHGVTGSGYARLTASGKAEPRSGAQLWAELARAHPGELVAIVTGPTSTLAQALELEPMLPRLLKRIVIMGGTFLGHPGNTTPLSEWNVDVDPEAAAAVCSAWSSASRAHPDTPLPLWCGLNLTEQAVWRPERSMSMRSRHDTELTRALDAALRFYFEFHDSMGEGYLAHVHDPFVAWIAVHPTRVLADPAQMTISCTDPATRGAITADFSSGAVQFAGEIARSLVDPYEADHVLDEILEAILTLPDPRHSSEAPHCKK